MHIPHFKVSIGEGHNLAKHCNIKLIFCWGIWNMLPGSYSLAPGYLNSTIFCSKYTFEWNLNRDFSIVLGCVKSFLKRNILPNIFHMNCFQGSRQKLTKQEVLNNNNSSRSNSNNNNNRISSEQPWLITRQCWRVRRTRWRSTSGGSSRWRRSTSRSFLLLCLARMEFIMT